MKAVPKLLAGFAAALALLVMVPAAASGAEFNGSARADRRRRSSFRSDIRD